MLSIIGFLLGLSRNAWQVVTLIIQIVKALQNDPQFAAYMAELAQLLRDLMTKQDTKNLVKDVAHDAPVSAFSAFLASVRKWVQTPY